MKPAQLKFRPTKGLWQNSTGSLKIDQNYNGFSYDWYQITRNIAGHVLLNTYPYSVSTRAHVKGARALLQAEGVSFFEVEAPRGLNNLEASHIALEQLMNGLCQTKKTKDRNRALELNMSYSRIARLMAKGVA